MASAAKCILGLGMAGAIAGTMLYASTLNFWELLSEVFTICPKTDDFTPLLW